MNVLSTISRQKRMINVLFDIGKYLIETFRIAVVFSNLTFRNRDVTGNPVNIRHYMKTTN